MSSTQAEPSRNRVLKAIRSHRVGAICGLLGPLLGFLAIAVSISLSASWFSWWTNALSDLGHPMMIGGINGIDGINPVAPIFNGGLILAALVSIIFELHLLNQFRHHGNLWGISGAILLLLSMIFLALVGVFHEGFLLPHAIAAIGFFFTLLISSFLVGIGFIRTQATRIEGFLGVAMGMVIAVTLIIGFSDLGPWTGVAIPEIIMAIAGFLWVISASIHLYRFGHAI